MTLSHWIALTATLLILASILMIREVWKMFRHTKEKRIALEAQKHMLRFCRSPTVRHWQAAWEYIASHEVRLISLDWPLVERFAKTAADTNFPPEEQRV